MPFAAPFRRPHIWQARIVTSSDGFYRGALDVIEPAEWADCAMVHDDRGEAWGSVAWLHDRPHEWWIGRYPFYAEKSEPPIMGAAEVVFAADMVADLLLVETPEAYVTRAWCGRWDGPLAVILDWRRTDAVMLWLSLVRHVRCESKRLADAVESAFRAATARQRLRIKLEV